MARDGLSQKGSADAAGVGQATVSEMLSKERVPRVKNLQRIAGALGADDVEALRAAGYVQRGDEFPGAEEAGRDGVAAGGGV
jgi:transcriptional regulator with XRE-family HTH domain